MRGNSWRLPARFKFNCDPFAIGCGRSVADFWTDGRTKSSKVRLVDNGGVLAVGASPSSSTTDRMVSETAGVSAKSVHVGFKSVP